jgi:hypothetical protein
MLFAVIAFILTLWGRKINRKGYKSELFLAEFSFESFERLSELLVLCRIAYTYEALAPFAERGAAALSIEILNKFISAIAFSNF